MAYKLVYPKSYIKKASKFLRRHLQLTGQYKKTLELLELNPHHPSLRLHGLGGKLEALHSVSINMSYRIVLELIITDKEIILVDVGDHGQVY